MTEGNGSKPTAEQQEAMRRMQEFGGIQHEVEVMAGAEVSESLARAERLFEVAKKGDQRARQTLRDMRDNVFDSRMRMLNTHDARLVQISRGNPDLELRQQALAQRIHEAVERMGAMRRSISEFLERPAEAPPVQAAAGGEPKHVEAPKDVLEEIRLNLGRALPKKLSATIRELDRPDFVINDEEALTKAKRAIASLAHTDVIATRKAGLSEAHTLAARLTGIEAVSATQDIEEVERVWRRAEVLKAPITNFEQHLQKYLANVRFATGEIAVPQEDREDGASYAERVRQLKEDAQRKAESAREDLMNDIPALDTVGIAIDLGAFHKELVQDLPWTANKADLEKINFGLGDKEKKLDIHPDHCKADDIQRRIEALQRVLTRLEELKDKKAFKDLSVATTVDEVLQTASFTTLILQNTFDKLRDPQYPFFYMGLYERKFYLTFVDNLEAFTDALEQQANTARATTPESATAAPGVPPVGDGAGGPRGPEGPPGGGDGRGPEEEPNEFIDRQLTILEEQLRKGAEIIRQEDRLHLPYPAGDSIPSHKKRLFFIEGPGGAAEPFLELRAVLNKIYKDYIGVHCKKVKHKDPKTVAVIESTREYLEQLLTSDAYQALLDLLYEDEEHGVFRAAGDYKTDEQENALVFAIGEFCRQTARGTADIIALINADETYTEEKSVNEPFKRRDGTMGVRKSVTTIKARIRYTAPPDPRRAEAAARGEAGAAGARAEGAAEAGREGEAVRMRVEMEPAANVLLAPLQALRGERFGLFAAERAASGRAVDELLRVIGMDRDDIIEAMEADFSNDNKRGYAADALFDIVDRFDKEYADGIVQEAEQVLAAYLNSRAGSSRFLGTPSAAEAKLTLKEDAEILELAQVWIIRRVAVWLAEHFVKATGEAMADVTLAKALDNRNFRHSPELGRYWESVRRQNEIAAALREINPPWNLDLQEIIEIIVWTEKRLGSFEDVESLLGSTKALIEQKRTQLEEDKKKKSEQTFAMHSGGQLLDAAGRIKGDTSTGVKKTSIHEKDYIKELLEFAEHFAHAMGRHESLALIALKGGEEIKIKISKSALRAALRAAAHAAQRGGVQTAELFLPGFVIPKKQMRRYADRTNRLHVSTRQAMEAIFEREGVSQRAIVENYLGRNKKETVLLPAPEGGEIIEMEREVQVGADIDARWASAAHMVQHKLNQDAKHTLEEYGVSATGKSHKTGGHGEHGGAPDVLGAKKEAERAMARAKVPFSKKTNKDTEISRAASERLVATNYLYAAVAEDMGAITDAIRRIAEVDPKEAGLLDKDVREVGVEFKERLRPWLEQLTDAEITAMPLLADRVNISEIERADLLLKQREALREACKRVKDLNFKKCDFNDHATLLDAFSAEAYNVRQAFEHRLFDDLHNRISHPLYNPMEFVGAGGNIVVYSLWFERAVETFSKTMGYSGGWATAGTVAVLVGGGWIAERLVHEGRHRFHPHGPVGFLFNEVGMRGLEYLVNGFNMTPFAYLTANRLLRRRHKKLAEELERRTPLVDIGKGAIMRLPQDYRGGIEGRGPIGLLERGGADEAEIAEATEDQDDEEGGREPTQ